MWGVGVNSPWALRHAFNAFDAWPVNIGFLGRGSSSSDAPLIEALAEGGASGFKVHEDMGAHARALDTALRVAEEYDVQVALHSDGLNECLSVEDTLRVLEGRTIHAFHIEGCGGGHVPNVLKMAGVPNVIGSSTNPTLPFGRDAVAEHYGMIVSVHDLKTDLPGDAAMARDRIRAGTMGAEDVLHDLGAIGITSSDAQGMGRAGETVRRTFAMAGKMKAELGAPDEHDNERVLRYIAKLTINPAIAHGLSHEVGSLEVGKLADIVLWRPEYFGAKPQLVLKSGFPAYGVVGDPNAATDTCEPLVLGPQFGAHGTTPADISVAFVAQAALDQGNDSMPTRRRRVAVRGTRGIGPADLRLNSRTGAVDVDQETGLVTLDGEPLRSSPPTRSPSTASTSSSAKRLGTCDELPYAPEWAPHERTWMAWPGPNPTFTNDEELAEARTAWASVARAVRRFEPVTMVHGPGQGESARALLGPDVDLVERELDDAWMRDIGPTFVTDGKGELAAVDWTFNGWGGQDWARWEHDSKIARHVADLTGAPVLGSALVNEGGAIHVDGEGTVLLTETVQLGAGRNPGWTRERVEAEIHARLGTSKAIWLPHGLTGDYGVYGTQGHVDIVAAFAAPGTVLVHSQRDPAHPDHARSQEYLALLRAQTDAKGRRLQVVEVPAPTVLKDEDGDWVDYSYINHYLCNGGVVLCAFDDPNDEIAAGIFRRLFPARTVTLVDARTIFAGGGGIHCITQQQPKV